MDKIFTIFIMTMFLMAYSDKKRLSKPIEVVKQFILFCEKGDIKSAKRLLAPNIKLSGDIKNLIYKNYDYKGDDDILNTHYELIKNISTNDIAFIKQTNNFLVRHKIYEKVIMLKKINKEWKIAKWVFIPLDVK